MSPRASRALRWAPRILCSAYAGFLSVFALDALAGGQTVAETASALLLHLLPAVLVVLGALYVSWAWGRFPWFVYLAVAGPLVLIGGLFLASSLARR
jgi:hypothetical protein